MNERIWGSSRGFKVKKRETRRGFGVNDRK